MFQWILSFLGGGPLSKVLTALNKAYTDKLNAKTETEKIDADERIKNLQTLAQDTANARASASGMPWWMAIMAFLFGIGFSLHTFFIAMGTAFQPIITNGWLDWWLHIPKLPTPYDQIEFGIIGFFFGSATIIGGTSIIANALTKRK